MAKVKGSKHNHQQFSIVMKFSVESLDQYAKEFKNTDFATIGSFDESESDDETKTNTNGKDDMDL